MGMEDAITFYRKDQLRSSFDTFQDMKKNGEFCDLTIKIQNKELHAHRVVVAAGIPYFRSVLANKSSEIKNKKIDIEELDPRALESLIDFAYTTKVDISLENVLSLLAASDFLEMTEVADACVQFLSTRILLNNVTKVRTQALSLNHRALTECCNRYSCEIFEEFSKTSDFFNLSPSCILEIISKDDLRVSGEEVVFEAVMNWVKAWPLERKYFLPQLLTEVRLIFISTDFLKTVTTDELIRDSTECMELIAKVKNFQDFRLPPGEEMSLKTRPRTINNSTKGIYAIGYSETLGHSVYKCDLTKGTWEKLTSRKSQKTYNVCCAVSVSEDIYLFFRKTVEKFNLRTLDWQVLKPTHDDNEGTIALSHKNMIYLFGSIFREFGKKVRCFHTGESKWLPEQKMKTSRWYSAAATIQESIYVTGGFSMKGWLCADAVSTVEKYDSVQGQSRSVAAMLTSRAAHGCASMNGKIYVCGGCTTETSFCDSAEVYDPMTDQWNFFSSMKTGKKFFSFLSNNGKIYSFGGVANSVDVADSQVYKPETDEWELGFPVPQEFKFAVLVSTNSD